MRRDSSSFRRQTQKLDIWRQRVTDISLWGRQIEQLLWQCDTCSKSNICNDINTDPIGLAGLVFITWHSRAITGARGSTREMWGRRGWQSRGRWGAQSGEGHTAMARSAREGEIVWSHLNMGKICLPSLGAPVTCFQLTWWWGISKSWRLCRSWSLSDNRENIRKIKLRKGWGQGRAGAISDYQPASQQMWSTAELRLTLREEEREESSITVTQLDWINSKYPTTAVTGSTFTTKRTQISFSRTFKRFWSQSWTFPVIQDGGSISEFWYE